MTARKKTGAKPRKVSERKSPEVQVASSTATEESTDWSDVWRRPSLDETPDYLVPGVGLHNDVSVSRFQSVYVTERSTSIDPKDLTELDGPVDLYPPAPAAPASAAPPTPTAPPAVNPSPAEGVVLFQEQSWSVKRLSLGNLVHSVCLAPGEVTRVAVVNWKRHSSGQQAETQSQVDSATQSMESSRAVQEVQEATANEIQHGSTTASSQSESDSEGRTGICALVGLSATSSGKNHGSTVATSVSTADSNRKLSADANQRAQQAADQSANASRSRRAAIVREVDESEAASAETRVIANYNHMHALTIEYFEVVELYEVRTEVVDARRCLFIPFKLMDPPALRANFGWLLPDLAERLGLADTAVALRNLRRDSKQVSAELKQLDTDLASAEAALAKAKKDHASALAAQESAADAEHAARHKLTEEANSSAVQLGIDSAFLRAFPSIDTALKDYASAQADLAAKKTDHQHASNEVLAKNRDLEKRSAQVVGLRAEIKKATDAMHLDDTKITERIQEHLLLFNQGVWLYALDSSHFQRVLETYAYEKENLGLVLDPVPVAISGEHIGFMYTSEKASEELASKFVRKEPATRTIALPTGGLFAEGVLGQAVSAEKIDLSRFWRWQDSPIPILPPQIKPVDTGSRAQAFDLTGANLDPSSAQLGAIPSLPDPTGLSSLLKTLGKGDLFRDISGGDAVAELAKAMGLASQHGTEESVKAAGQTFSKYVDFLTSIAPLVADAATDGAASGATIAGGKINEEAKGTKGKGAPNF